MTTRHHGDGGEAKIIELVVGDDCAQAANLARYWDATVQGQLADRRDLDPELTTVVQLLRYYHGMPDSHRETLVTSAPALDSPHADQPHGAQHVAARTGGRGGRHDPARPLTRAAVGLTAIFLVVFAVNTMTSPRSWLSGASDPDWIPWVSDNWMSAVWDGV